MENRQYQSEQSEYKFTSKERDNESNYDYFGARYYDSRLARWGSIDPFLEKHINWTPYNYVLGNPLIYIDPDGKQTMVVEATAIEVIAQSVGATVEATAIEVIAQSVGATVVGGSVVVGAAVVASAATGFILGHITYQEIIHPALYPPPMPIAKPLPEWPVFVIPDNPVGETPAFIIIDPNYIVGQPVYPGSEKPNLPLPPYLENRRQDLFGKTPQEVLPGDIKRAPRYASELENTIYEEIVKISRDKKHPLNKKAKTMKKFMEQLKRLTGD